MNKHFEEARYHLKRAMETASMGLREEIEPVEARVRELTGRDEAPEESRLEAIREELGALEERAEGEAREAIAEARAKLSTYREQLAR